MYEVILNPIPLPSDGRDTHHNNRRLSALLSTRLSVLADELYAKLQVKSDRTTTLEIQDPAIDRWDNEGGDV
jgi:hypothetical protein